MYKLYTAAGRLQMNGNLGNQKYPMVILGSREYILDIQEMMLWTILNWRILDIQEVALLYDAKAQEVGYATHRNIHNCLHRLLQRGLVSEGCGETGADALYDLLSELYIIPISENIFLRALSFFKLTFLNGVPFRVTRKVLGTDKRSDDERKVMQLAGQALMSTAEIIQCVEQSSLSFENDDQLMEALYHDDITTCDNIAMLARQLSACRPILTSVANLYLRKQIIFERL